MIYVTWKGQQEALETRSLPNAGISGLQLLKTFSQLSISSVLAVCLSFVFGSVSGSISAKPQSGGLRQGETGDYHHAMTFT